MEILQLALFGLVLGGIISLGAIGVSLLFGILRFAHFAHGDLMTVGAYAALALVAMGWPLWAAFPVAVLAGILVALAVDALIYRRLRRTAPVILLISSVGVALILRSLIQIIWGADTQVYDQALQFPLRFWGLRLKLNQLYILLGSVGLVMLVHVFLQYTKLGKAMRAMADNPDLAKLSGINTERVILYTWCLGAGLAVAAGIFLGVDTRLQPTMGWHLLLPVFAATILGGIGKPYGAIVGGMVVGLASELSTVVLPPAYKTAVAFAIMVVMLIVKPSGLFGGGKR